MEEGSTTKRKSVNLL